MVTLPWWGYVLGIGLGIVLIGWGLLSNAKKKNDYED